MGPERRTEPQQEVCVLRESPAKTRQLLELRDVLVDETTHVLLGIRGVTKGTAHQPQILLRDTRLQGAARGGTSVDGTTKDPNPFA